MTTGISAQAAALGSRLQEQAMGTLRALLESATAKADDALFDLSQKAPADEQSAYFSAMREVRLQRQGIADRTLGGYLEAFQAIAKGKPATSVSKPAATFSLDTLTLVDDDELEVDVAFRAMLGRFSDNLSTDLDHLRQRYGMLLGREVEAEELPLHPEKVCDAFRKAVEPLKLDLKVRLILFKLYERVVLEGLREVISAANQVLSQAGILPEIQPPKARPRSGGAAGRSGGGGRARDTVSRSAASVEDDVGEDGGGAGTAVGGALTELLALARGLSRGGPPAGLLPGNPSWTGVPGMPQQAYLPPGYMAVPISSMPGGGGYPAPGPDGVLPPGFSQSGMPSSPMVLRAEEIPAGRIPVLYGGQAVVDGRVLQSEVPVQALASNELLSMLTRLQQMGMPPLAPHGATAPQAVEDVAPIDVQEGLSGLLQEEAAGAPRAIHGADNDVISLVSMLFDFILEDQDIPPQIKALIGRLQIPVLKVALADRKFFDRDDHPARSLVNRMARAGVGWSADTDDGLYARFDEIVKTVLSGFSDDISLFGRLLSGLELFLVDRERRMSMIEARLREREEAQARAAQAREVVSETIATKIANRRLPPEIITLVQEAWQYVLNLSATRDGLESVSWQQRVRILEVLVQCSQSYEKTELREKQRALMPRLMSGLRRALKDEGFDAVRAGKLLEAAEKALRKVQSGDTLHTVRVVTREVAIDNVEVAQAESAIVGAEPVDDEVVITRTVPTPAPTIAADSAVDERWRQTADSLAPGTWLEFADSEGGLKVRAKIVARIRSLDKFIFVNARGSKIAEKTVMQLAGDLESGRARLVSDEALFDRALESMITKLRAGSTK